MGDNTVHRPCRSDCVYPIACGNLHIADRLDAKYLIRQPWGRPHKGIVNNERTHFFPIASTYQ